MEFKRFIKKIPMVRTFAKVAWRFLHPFQGSGRYWDDRYYKLGNSGAGSYGRLAEFKAEVLNEFVQKNGIQTVIEFGCGDGNQLTLAKYPHYIGVDVSSTAISICRKLFENQSINRSHSYV